ncbi:hypothetical protein F66182_9171 [Fusarium sp. NRRL 66182]|nr:hypothetical protein F66182_9171 [Fusarium sp. NRRL 66182]
MDAGLPDSREDELHVVLEDPLQPTSIKKRQQPAYTIPPTEEQWRSCLGSWDQRELKNWEKLVVIAATVVDLDRGQEEDKLQFGKAYDSRMSYITYRKDRAAVLNLIKLLDRLYASLEHRAFELLRALKTKTLTQDDLDLFQETYRTRQCAPSLLSTLGDFRTPHCKLEATSSQPSQELLVPNDYDSELASALHLDKMFPVVVNIHIKGYTTFNMPQELQRKASQADKKQEVCNIIERHNTCISQYEWSDRFHLPVANQAIDDLGSYTKMMS